MLRHALFAAAALSTACQGVADDPQALGLAEMHQALIANGTHVQYQAPGAPLVDVQVTQYDRWYRIDVVGTDLDDTITFLEVNGSPVFTFSVTDPTTGQEVARQTFNCSVGSVPCGAIGIEWIEVWMGDGDDTFFTQDGLGTELVHFGSEVQEIECTLNVHGEGGADLIEGAPCATGGDGADTLIGNDGYNTLTGGFGDDVIEGLGALDIIRGGAGDDILRGGGGGDRMWGSTGDDLMYGDAGEDEMYGDAGEDRIYGGADDDYIHGGDQGDRLYGEAGADYIAGGDGPDYIYGGDGQDSLHGNSGGDYLNGGSNNDRMFGGGGADRLYGGGGKDHIRGSGGNDYADGEGGNDDCVAERKKSC